MPTTYMPTPLWWMAAPVGPAQTYPLPIREYAFVCVCAALVTFFSAGLVRKIARKTGAVTAIRERDVHTVPTPRMGGVAIYLGFTVAVLVSFNLRNFARAFTESTEVFGVLVAGGFICFIGVLDDRFNLDAWTKLAGQVVAAGVLVLFGVQWVQLWIPSNGGTVALLSQTQGLVVTVAITLILANAMNFIDGLDGLLAGVALIAMTGLLVFSSYELHLSGIYTVASQAPLIAAALVGALIGFLPHNFFPARMFMGDSGSMFLGLAMAATIVTASGQLDPSVTIGPRSTLALLAPVIVMAAVVLLPVLDLGMAVVRRTREGRHPFSADKRHLHHRMLNLGHTHRGAVLVFYLWALVITAAAAALAFTKWQNVIWPFLGGLVLALLALLWPPLRTRRRVRRHAARGRTAESAEAAEPRAGT